MDNPEVEKILDEIVEIEQETVKRILDDNSEKIVIGDKPKKSKGKELVRSSGIKRAANGEFYALYSDGVSKIKVYRKDKEDLKNKITEK